MDGFWQMGGYAAYVWGSFGAALAVYGWNLWAPGAQRRAWWRDQEDA